MKYPNLNEEKKLWKEGYNFIVGLDESGRGPLSGPVVAAAVFVKKFPISLDARRRTPRRVAFQFPKIKDGKKLSPKKREKIYEFLKKNPNIEWGIGRVSEKVIDKINILEATKLAMKKAVRSLEKKLQNNPLQNSHDRENSAGGCFLIIDGNFGIRIAQPSSRPPIAGGTRDIRKRPSECIPQKSIIKGDEKVFSCAASSIIAKVTRDRMMMRYHKKYPQYGFDKHKGYPTKLHREMLKKYGPCKIHRKSFGPVNEKPKIKNQKSKTQISKL